MPPNQHKPLCQLASSATVQSACQEATAKRCPSMRSMSVIYKVDNVIFCDRRWIYKYIHDSAASPSLVPRQHSGTISGIETPAAPHLAQHVDNPVMAYWAACGHVSFKDAQQNMQHGNSARSSSRSFGVTLELRVSMRHLLLFFHSRPQCENQCYSQSVLLP